MTEKSQRAPNGKAPSHTGGPALRNRTVVSEKEVSDPGASAVTSLESRGRPDETPPWTIASGSADPGPGDVSDLGDRYSKQFGIPAERIIVSKTLLTGILGVGSKTVDASSRDAPGCRAWSWASRIPTLTGSTTSSRSSSGYATARTETAWRMDRRRPRGPV